MDIRGLLAAAKITPNKELGQHFLQDDKTLDEEVALAKLTSKDVVLEVGAGLGNLTIRLSKKAKVLAVEKDYSFSKILKNIPNTDLVLGDALEFLESLRSAKATGKFNKIVSNIPYAISQDLLLEFFRHKWDTAVLIVQKEFAEKLKSKERLGLVLSELAEIKIAKDVPASYFYPPAVPSSIIVLKQKKQIDYDFWQFLCKLKPNKNVNVVIKKAPASLAKKKVHQLTLAELKALFKLTQ
jgi:16S rRNA (adenine1518-N6/adenine1519-N6)-dimethyltransferase